MPARRSGVVEVFKRPNGMPPVTPEPGHTRRDRFDGAVGRLAGADPSRWLVAFDFDGTLSPIVPRPEDARLDPELEPLLAELRQRVGWVAVVSGRPREFLEAQVPGALALGSYGLELPPELSGTELAPGFSVDDARARLNAARAELERAAIAGARLEIKPWGIGVHYRDAGPSFEEGHAREVVNEVAEHNRLAVQRGRLVFELKPKEAADKGWAMRLLVSRLHPSAAIFTGDDLGDGPAWAALNAVDLPSLSVGITSAELPPDTLEACDLVLESRDELHAFVAALLAAARGTTG